MLAYGLTMKSSLSHRYTFRPPLTSAEQSIFIIIGVGAVLGLIGVFVLVSKFYMDKNVVEINATDDMGRVCPHCHTRVIGNVNICPNCKQALDK